MTRLLFLTAETCPTFRVDVTVLFGKYLPRLKIYSDIVAGRTEGHVGAIKWGGGEAFLCQREKNATRRRLLLFLHNLRHILSADRNRYVAIQVRDMPVVAAVGLLAARLKGLAFVYWMSYRIPEGQIALARGRGLSEGLMKFLYPWLSGRVGRFALYRIVLPHATHVFVQSDHMKQDLVANGVSPRKMTAVPMGVDLDTLKADEISPAEDPRLKGRHVLVYLGTLDRPRRIEILFAMLALVLTKLPNALLVLVGDTHDESHARWLREQAIAEGVEEHVLWTGWLPMNEGWRYVKSAQLGLSPIPRGYLLDSASPTKVPEYLALNVPVVCNDNPDQQHIIERTGAGRCVPYTALDFARAVIEVSEIGSSERQQMLRRGREWVASTRDYALLAKHVASVFHKKLEAIC